MDNNQKPTQDTICANEFSDWRDQLQRQRIVNKIMDVLKKHLPFSRHELLQELEKIAERVEAEIYTAASNQSEYSRKTCYMILTMETRLQSPMRSNSTANRIYSSVPLDQLGNINSKDWQEEVYLKIKVMKDLYLLELRPTKGANGEIGDPTIYSGGWRAQLLADSRQRITNKIFDTLKRHIPFSGPDGLSEIKKIAERFEERMYVAATSQSDYLRKISLKMLTMEAKYPVTDTMQ